jgi:phosphatidylglycerophosphate synthase
MTPSNNESNHEARRPLKSRGTAWASFFAKSLLKLSFTPNAVSVFSLVFAALAGGAMLMAARGCCGMSGLWWLVAAAGIQLRLFCNLMDGLLAIEGGLKSPTGDLYNEIPDRLGDAFILVPLGYAGGTDWSIALGWAATAGAIFTAYIRTLGASLLGKHDFSGPMAKPHRMAAATVGVLIMAGLCFIGKWAPLPFWTLIVINAGVVITLIRRTLRLATALKNKS